jgi:hypothetical protein
MHKLARLTPMGRLRMVRRLEAGERLRDLATALDLSTTSVRRWWRRYQQEEVAGLTALPGELVQLDIKKLGRFRRVGHRIHGDHGRRSRGSGVEFLHIAIDDRTCLAYAALVPDETAASAAAFLALVHRWFATRGVVIRALLTDNGSAYRGHRFGDQRQGGTLYSHLSRGMGLRPLVPDLRRSGERPARLPAILQPGRFHMGINGLTPMQRLAAHQ